MRRNFSCSWRTVVVCGAAALACSAQADTGSPGLPEAPKLKPKPQALGATPSAAKWVAAPSKHNGSGVRLRYSVPDTLQPGEAARVQLQFSGVTSEGATAELRAPEGATLVTDSGQAPGRIALPVGQVTTVALQVVPSGDGLQAIDVFTSQAERSSVQSVPLNVGSGAVKLEPIGKAQTTPSGEKVISLPAQTSTK